jgi:hypothetical protein
MSPSDGVSVGAVFRVWIVNIAVVEASAAGSIGCKNAGRRGTKFSCAIAWLGIVKNRWPREPIGIAEAIASSGHDDNFPCCFVNDAALNRPQFVSERDLAKPSKGKYP